MVRDLRGVGGKLAKDGRSATYTAYFFTGRKKWLDVIELKHTQHDDDSVAIDASSCSAGVVPCSTPFSLVLSMALSFVLFSDWGQNKNHLRTVSKLLMEAGWEISEEKSGGAEHRVSPEASGSKVD